MTFSAVTVMPFKHHFRMFPYGSDYIIHISGAALVSGLSVSSALR